MDKGSKAFGTDKVSDLLIKFSIPIILSMLIAELYSMVDTMYVGNFVGGDGIAGLVLVFPIQRLLIALSSMIALGTSTAFSRANGREDREEARKIVNNGFSLALTLMLTITAVIYIFRKPILVFLGASPSILPYAEDYLGIIIFGSTFLSLTMFISNIILALGDNRVAIIANSIGAIMNIIVDHFLVVKIGMGVKGAAIATVFSQVSAFSFAYYRYSKAKKEYGLASGFSLNGSMILPILAVGISSFIVEAEDGIVIGVLNNLLGSTVGDSGIVVLGVITKVYMFLFVTMFGIASAMQPIVAYNVGARNHKRVEEIIKKTILYASVATGVLWLLGMIFTPQVISLFVKEADIIDKSVDAFRIMVLFFPLISVYYVSIFYYQALGRARSSILLSIFRQIIVMIPVSIILMKGFKLGAMGAWLSYPISDLLSCGVSWYFMRQEFKTLEIKAEKAKREKYEEKFVLN